MTKPILAICLAAIGFGGLFQSNASAHEATAPAKVEVSAMAAQPAIAHVNVEIIVAGGRRHYYHRRYYHRRYYWRHHRRYYY